MSDFLAYLDRMKFIERWSLMRSVRKENILEHTAQVAQIAYLLGIIGNTLFLKEYNIEKLVSIALFHEISEVITGDLPTPIKYFDKDITSSFKHIENLAVDQIILQLPDKLQPQLKSITTNDNSVEFRLVKIADKMAAYIKCIEESKANNAEFDKANSALKKEVIKYTHDYQEVKYLFDNFFPALSKPLDDLNKRPFKNM